MPHTNLPALWPQQRERLQAFRRAAADLYRLLGERLGAELTFGSKGRQLLSEVELRSAATALRLTLLQGEQAHFADVLASLYLLQDPAICTRLDEFSDAWKRVEQGAVAFHVEGRSLAGREIRDAWLYGQVT